jgi:hypothetical protein
MAKRTWWRIGCVSFGVWVCGSEGLSGQPHQPSLAGWEYAQTRAYDETVGRALALLPKQPKQVVVIDAEKTPTALRQRLERVEAFVMVGEPIVCLRMQGTVLKNAQRTGGLFDYALAATIWHEMAHIAGADERAAQEQEEDLWRQFILGGRVDTSRALAYLNLLKQRRGSDDTTRGVAPHSMEIAR